MFENPYQKQACLISRWLLANANCNIHRDNGATTVVSIKPANVTD